MKYILILIAVFSMCSPKKEETGAGKAVQARKSDSLPENVHMIDTAKNIIRSGDLVFRTGNDLVSYYFKEMNLKDKTYSHCGIASVENGQVYIYHILGGEFNPGEHVLHEPLKKFVSPYDNDGFGIGRYPLTPAEQEELIKTVKLVHDAGVRFDMQLDLETDEKMYCAEFVYKCMLIATKGRIRPELTRVPFRTGITIDNLSMNRNCRELGRFVYR